MLTSMVMVSQLQTPRGLLLGRHFGGRYAGYYLRGGITYGGSSPSMEPAGAVWLYECSAESLNLQYTGFIRDGDTKLHSSVVNKHPYWHGVEIVKKGCVGHVQKK